MAKIIKNTLSNFLTILLIFLMIAAWIFSGLPQIWQNPPIPPEIEEARAETLSLYVDSYDASSNNWTKVGTSPYLNAQDQPTHYIYSTSRNVNDGNYGFANTSETGTINSVYLYIYAYGVSTTDFTTILSGTDTGLGPPAGSWTWVNVDVSTILDTWDKINAATVLFDRPNTTNDAGVDAAYLYVDYTPPAADITAPSSVQMPDYTIGGAGYSERNFNDIPALVQVTANTGFTVTVSSTNLTGTNNTILASDVKLKTDGTTSTNPTVITNCAGFSGITETASGEYALDTAQTIVTTSSGSGTCDIYPTIRVYIDNFNIYVEEDTGILTFTVTTP